MKRKLNSLIQSVLMSLKFIGQEKVEFLEMVMNISLEKLKNKVISLNKIIDLLINTEEVFLVLGLAGEDFRKYLQTSELVVKFLQCFDQEISDLHEARNEIPHLKDLSSMVVSQLFLPRNSKVDYPKFLFSHMEIREEYLTSFQTYLNHQQSQVFRDIVVKLHKNRMVSKNLPNTDDESESENDDQESSKLHILVNLILGRVVYPALDEFKKCAENIEKGNIAINGVEEMFMGYEDDFKELKKELRNMSSLSNIKDLVDSSYEKICQCLKLGKLQHVAQTIDNSCKVLGIRESFPELNKILKMSTDENQVTFLKEISLEDVEVGEFLSALDEETTPAIAKIEMCQALIVWLKDSINNVQEFKFFVDLAHISAGESDMEVDRVMCMQSSVNAYAGYIWDLDEDSDMAKFMEATNTLRNALSLDVNIKQKFHDTNRHLLWIKNIKERHGSVETSSLQEVEKINKTGVYKISNWGCSDEHIIRLSFQEVHEEETVRYANREYQKMLSEDDLKELKSKLALITKSSEANMEVEAFVHKIFRNMIGIFYCDESRKVKTEINLGNTGLISGEIPINLELPSLTQFFNDSYLDGKEISLHSKLLLQCLSNNISVDMLHNILKNLDDKVLVEDEYFQWCLDNMSDGDVIESLSDEFLKTKD